MRISVFKDGFTNLVSNETIEDWDEFVDRLIDVQVGTKNGAYMVRGFCDGPRSDTNMKTLELIVIDGDQTIEMGNTCVPLEPVHEILKSQNIKHCIHSSYSQNIANNIYKWRCYIPCDDLVDAGALKEGVAEVISLLHGEGIMVRNVHENGVESQPWFTPRCPEGLEEDFTCLYHDGEPWKLGKVEVLSSCLVGNNGDGKTGTGFSWSWAISQLKSGTVHQAAKSIVGWLILTTDWVPSQIKAYLIELITELCSDPVKVKRACETKEIDSLIQYCREKHGVIEYSANWKEDLMSNDELKTKIFDPVKWAVDGIIPEGLTVLAGDPKAGKSLLAVDICTAISSGVEAFGNRKCVQGTCVYVSLEDPPRRIQARIKQQSDLWSDKFKILTRLPYQLGDDFYKMLDEMILLWPDLRCIVIDTMQYIMPPKANNVSDYNHIYTHLDPLHRWVLDNHIAIILITHLTKARLIEGENPFSSIIGSVAVQGVSDAMILLRKNHAKTGLLVNDPDTPDGFLTIQGREMGSDKFALDFDHEALRWCIIREADIRDETANPNYLLIADALKKNPMGAEKLSSVLKMNKHTIKTCLLRMLNKNLLVKLDRGVYGLVGVDYGNQNPW